MNFPVPESRPSLNDLFVLIGRLLRPRAAGTAAGLGPPMRAGPRSRPLPLSL
jgi:hypothetical protein